MGLIKAGIYAGTAYAIFNKASGEHQRANSNSRQLQYMQFQQLSRSRGVSPSGSAGSEYVHAHYCNSHCQNQCKPSAYAAAGSAGQYYDSAPQQHRTLEYEQEPLPTYGNASMGMGKEDFGDLASIAERFLKK